MGSSAEKPFMPFMGVVSCAGVVKSEVSCSGKDWAEGL